MHTFRPLIAIMRFMVNSHHLHFISNVESLALSCKSLDRDCRSQSLIFFEQHYYLAVKLMPQFLLAKHNLLLAVKVCQTKLTMSPSEFLFRTDIDSTDLDIRLVNQL